jgi:hypothetical protein
VKVVEKNYESWLLEYALLLICVYAGILCGGDVDEGFQLRVVWWLSYLQESLHAWHGY